jgi:sugar lactone lactonase YvrE
VIGTRDGSDGSLSNEGLAVRRASSTTLGLLFALCALLASFAFPLAASALPTYQSSLGASGTGEGQFAHPGDVAVDSAGNLWVVDTNNHRVQKFNSEGKYQSKIGTGTKGTANGVFDTPTAVAIDSKGNLWVADHGNNRVQEFSSAGTWLLSLGKSGSSNGEFNGPEGIAIDSKDNIYVSDSSRVQKFNSSGVWVKNIGSKGTGSGQFSTPNALDVGPGDVLWTTDYTNNRVSKFDEAGTFLLQIGGTEGTADGQFKHPTAIDIDAAGSAWVGDLGNNRVQEFNSSGTYVTKFGAAGTGPGQFAFGYPFGLAADAKGGVWVADTNNNRVQRWTYSAPETTITSPQPSYTAGAKNSITFTSSESGSTFKCRIADLMGSFTACVSPLSPTSLGVEIGPGWHTLKSSPRIKTGTTMRQRPHGNSTPAPMRPHQRATSWYLRKRGREALTTSR